MAPGGLVTFLASFQLFRINPFGRANEPSEPNEPSKVSNYSELIHSVGKALVKSFGHPYVEIEVSNYSELTHSVGPVAVASAPSAPQGFQLFRINPFGRAGTIWAHFTVTIVVSNYSELTHSVGALQVVALLESWDKESRFPTIPN